MADMKVRDVDPTIKKKLSHMAKQKNMSQNAFLRAHLERIALHENVFSEEKNRIEERLLLHTNVFAAFAKTNEELFQKVVKVEQLLSKFVDEGGAV